MSRRLPRALVLVAALLPGLPRAAFACAMCVGASGRNAAAYAASAVFLSAVPLGSLFGFLAYLRRRVRRLDQSAESPR